MSNTTPAGDGGGRSILRARGRRPVRGHRTKRKNLSPQSRADWYGVIRPGIDVAERWSTHGADALIAPNPP